MLLDVANLHPLEVKVLRAFTKEENFTASDVEKKCSFSSGHANQALSWLLAKKLIEQVSKQTLVSYEITQRGRDAIKKGLIIRRILDAIRKNPDILLTQLPEILQEEQQYIGADFALLKKLHIIKLLEDKRMLLEPGASLPENVKVLENLLHRAVETGVLAFASLSEEEQKEIVKFAKKRSDDQFFRIVEKDIVTYCLTNDGIEAKETLISRGITGEELGECTKEILEKQLYKTKRFREYDVLHAPVAKIEIARENPYSSFIRTIKDKLVAMGFEEFDGPLVENEFWNGDALFMPQFHAARDIHDVYYIDSPSHSRDIEEPYFSRVKATHENGGGFSRGWQYPFDRNFALRNLLRSQGTVVSAHTLTKAKVPGRYFGVLRCFRYDQVDATHGSDFYQTEGIVLGEKVNLKTLLGLLEMFAVEIAGAKEVKYVPGYFPFTEPSVEVHIKHPVLGWFEMGGSGIFRKEVTKPLGIDCPVLAWGLGIDRMALMNLKLNDIRELFSDNIENVRLRRG